jgi:hypothetical protein
MNGLHPRARCTFWLCLFVPLWRVEVLLAASILLGDVARWTKWGISTV